MCRFIFPVVLFFAFFGFSIAGQFIVLGDGDNDYFKPGRKLILHWKHPETAGWFAMYFTDYTSEYPPATSLYCDITEPCQNVLSISRFGEEAMITGNLVKGRSFFGMNPSPFRSGIEVEMNITASAYDEKFRIVMHEINANKKSKYLVDGINFNIKAMEINGEISSFDWQLLQYDDGLDWTYPKYNDDKE